MSDRFYVTTPIYYVNDAPHIGHAYPTVIADALARWHRLLGDDTYFLTGTDEHGLKVAQSAEEAGLTPLEQADRNSDRFKATWDSLGISYDDFIRTTEPRHHAAVQELLQRIKDNGDIELDTYEGPYCVSCEAYYQEGELIDGTFCPIHTRRPVTTLKEENYFFRLSRYEQRLIDWIEANPEVITPEGKRNEVLGFLRQGLRRRLDHPYLAHLGRAGAVGRWPRLLRLVRRAHQLRHRHRLRHRRRALRGVVAARAPRHRQGDHPVPLRVLAGDAHGRRDRAAPPHPRPRVAAVGRREAVQDRDRPGQAHRHRPSRLVEDFGVDGVRYHLLRDTPFGPDGDFSYERVLERYNGDLANNFGNLVSRVATVVDKKCGGIGPAPRPDSPLAAVAAEVLEAATAAWEGVAPSIALDATWRLIRETNAHLEDNEPWKQEPGPAVDAVMGDALEALRLVAILASPAIPAAAQEAWRRIGLPGAPEDQRLPEAAAWGGYPGGLPVAKGEPIFPRLKA